MLTVSRNQIGIVFAQSDFVKHDILGVGEDLVEGFSPLELQAGPLDVVDYGIYILLLKIELVA